MVAANVAVTLNCMVSEILSFGEASDFDSGLFWTDLFVIKYDRQVNSRATYSKPTTISLTIPIEIQAVTKFSDHNFQPVSHLEKLY